MTTQNNYLSWLLQAENDLQWGEDSLNRKYYAQTCFISQQVAEKALKALAYFRGHDVIKGHSTQHIAKLLKENGDIEKAARRLDLYYISTRYPDALPDAGVPFEYFDEEQAREALDFAHFIYQAVKKYINP